MPRTSAATATSRAARCRAKGGRSHAHAQRLPKRVAGFHVASQTRPAKAASTLHCPSAHSTTEQAGKTTKVTEHGGVVSVRTTPTTGTQRPVASAQTVREAEAYKVAAQKGRGTTPLCPTRTVVASLDSAAATANRPRTSTPAACRQRAVYGRTARHGATETKGLRQAIHTYRVRRGEQGRQEPTRRRAYSSLPGTGNEPPGTHGRNG